MKKLEDLMMHLRGEKRDSLINNVLFLCIIFFASLVNAQHLNLFNISKIPKGYTKFKFLNSKNDSLKLLLYGNTGKNVTIIDNFSQEYPSVKKSFFFYPVSEYEEFNRKAGNTSYIFLSREKKICGIFSIGKYNNLKLLSQIKLNEHYNNLIVNDFNNDDKTEAALYGPTSDGITFVEEINYLLTTRKIYEGKTFSYLKTIDFNFDEFADLLAVDNINNELLLLQNLNNYYFETVRKIKLPSEISSFKLIPNEQFYDLIYSSGKTVEYIIADSVYSFQNKHSFSLPFKGIHNIYYYGNEIVFLSTNNNLLNFNHKTGNSKTLLENFDITDYKFVNNKLFALSKKGYLFITPQGETKDFYLPFNDTIKVVGVLRNGLILKSNSQLFLLTDDFAKVLISLIDINDKIILNGNHILKYSNKNVSLLEIKNKRIVIKENEPLPEIDELVGFSYKNNQLKISFTKSDSLFLYKNKSTSFISEVDYCTSLNDNVIYTLKNKSFSFNLVNEKIKALKNINLNVYSHKNHVITSSNNKLVIKRERNKKIINFSSKIDKIKLSDQNVVVKTGKGNIYKVNITNFDKSLICKHTGQFFVTKFFNNKFYVIFPELNNRTLRFLEIE